MPEKFDVIVAKPAKYEGFLSPGIEERTDESITEVYIKDSLRNLKKLSKIADGRKIITSDGVLMKKTTKGYLKKYDYYYSGMFLCILEKLVMQTSIRYKLSYPVSEIFIMANPIDAVKIVSSIKKSSKLFTVVSDFDVPARMYDELYFKYGTVIRQTNGFCSISSEGALIIKCNENSEIPSNIKYPVINLEKNAQNDSMTVAARKVCVYDDRIKRIVDAWGGKPSLLLYSLLNITPQNNTSVDIAGDADEIFLLDTARL